MAQILPESPLLSTTTCSVVGTYEATYGDKLMWLGDGYVLPPDEVTAYTTVIYGVPNPVNPTYSHPIPDLTYFFPLGATSFVIHYGQDGIVLAQPLQVFYCPVTLTIGGLRPNRAIAALTSLIPHAPSRWAGGVVVMKFTDNTCTSYTDFTLSDITHIQYVFSCGGQ
ncbi:hypothetical protein K466DRAFT_602758 [Polyporus arcularius HHB13444]|uniref:Uncharacterized protein n=1 Tax=Polyporus arcularius HHB13444 TaxID=1314778 RepID=A0A5C3P1N9_9APHY|nr:hypothetical protein K466DRAFT_602758 [Polyporus arcularius HHB13444]